MNSKDESLEERVKRFKTMSLPGQPVATHMGTSDLVNDLWREVKSLREQLAKGTKREGGE